MRSVFDNFLSIFSRRGALDGRIDPYKSLHPANTEVDSERPELEKMLPIYTKLRDCLAGEDHIKSLGPTYLPRPSTEKGKEEEERYKAYLMRADFLNVTGFTQRTTIGKLFTKPPTIELPPQLEPLRDNINGEGLSFEQLIELLAGEVFAFGRVGVYADFRSMPTDAVSLADTENLMPTLTYVRPENIINWRVDKETKKLTMVVIREYEEEYDEFAVTLKPQYRVFRLDPNLTVEVWQPAANQVTETIKRYERVSTDTPSLPGGMPWAEIPFAIIGAANNDWTIDPPPLYQLANIDFSYYRNSADIEEAAHIIGQPTPYVTGLKRDWVEQFGLHKLRYGSGRFIPLPEANSKVGLVQPSAETMLDKLMDMKEKRFREFGGITINPDNVSSDQTATGAIYQALQLHAPLVSASRNVVTGVRKALGYAAMFIGVDPESEQIVIKLNSDILDNPLGVTGLQIAKELWIDGAITFDELREQLSIHDITLHTPDEARTIIEEEGLVTRNRDVNNDPNDDDDEDEDEE